MKFVNDIFCYHFQLHNSIISLLIAETSRNYDADFLNRDSVKPILMQFD